MSELKDCPFCGGKTGINFTQENFQSIGCEDTSMLCPNPSLIVYKDKDGKFDYTFWNRRAK